MFRFWAIGALLLCIICNSDAVPCSLPNHCVAGGTCKNKVIGTCFFSEECCAPGIGGPQVTQNGQNQGHAQFPQLIEVPQSQLSVPRNPNPEPQEHANLIKPNSNPVHQIQQIQKPPEYPSPIDPTFPPGQQFPQPEVYDPRKFVIQELPKFTSSETPKFPIPEPPKYPNPEPPKYPNPEPPKYPNPEPPQYPNPEPPKYPNPEPPKYPNPEPPKYPNPEPPKFPNPAPPSHQLKPAPAPKEPYDENCGWSNRNPIIASEPVRHQYPWTIALFNHGNYFASGSLVSPGVVVTVAHLINTTKIVARAGDYDFLLRVEQFPPDERHVARIQIHNNYQPQNGANNIALLFLESPFTLRTHIRTICLPQQYKSFDSQRCVTAGWSKLSVMKLQDSDVQTQKELTVAQKDCQNMFRANYQRPEGLICTAGVGDNNACTVDSGSPLFCPLENQPHRYELAGISSRNYDCGQERVVSLFTDVSELSGWIKEQLQQGVEGNPGKITPKIG